MAVKVVVDPTAAPTANKLVSLLTQVQTEVTQIATAGQHLVDPNFWDGVGANEFRGLWPGEVSTLKTTVAKMLTEAQEAQKNITAIDSADVANQVR
jgi:hypothetical protein